MHLAGRPPLHSMQHVVVVVVEQQAAPLAFVSLRPAPPYACLLRSRRFLQGAAFSVAERLPAHTAIGEGEQQPATPAPAAAVDPAALTPQAVAIELICRCVLAGAGRGRSFGWQCRKAGWPHLCGKQQVATGSLATFGAQALYAGTKITATAVR